MLHRIVQKPTLTEWVKLSPLERADWLAWDIFRQREMSRIIDSLSEAIGHISPEVYALIELARLSG